MEKTVQRMMALIENVFKKEKQAFPPILEEGAKSLFMLAKSHDLAHLVGYAIEQTGVEIPEIVKKKFNAEQTLAVCRYEQQNYEFTELCEGFERLGIDFLPLKGSVLRSYYPEPWLRTSCDIDILVKEEDLERAGAFLTEELGYEFSLKKSNDVSYFSVGGVHLELHYNLIESGAMDKGQALLSRAWAVAVPVDGWAHRKAFKDDMFYYYHIIHMAKHYTYGGCGVRPFLDIYVLRNFVEFDERAREALLAEGELLTFAKHAEHLSAVWFGGAEHTPITKQMEDYILGSGTYGTMQNRVAVQQARRGGKIGYFFSRVFMPYEQLKGQYSGLEGRKWLTPFYQIRRWFRLIFCGRMKSSVEELKCANDTDKSTQAEAEKMLRELGLK